MIRRFFKKAISNKAPETKKTDEVVSVPVSSPIKPIPHTRLLTAEGWKRMMIRKSSKGRD